ncbi:MAG: cell division topological specificity factor MinE [Clostridia bacterium]|nr:cell division topological specificity factor MinE [Clostridia bacterium]
MDLKKRLNNVIQKDKENNPKYLINVIKSDFYYLINNYFEVDFEDLDIAINLKDDKYIISLNCKGDRMKLMKALPQ